MIKKRRNFSLGASEFLADVNEQELAKDTLSNTKRLLNTNTGRDDSEKYGEALPVNICAETEQKSSTEKPKALPPHDEYPSLESGDACGKNEKKSAEQDTHANQAGGRRGGGIYAAVILLSLLAGIVAVIFAAIGQPTAPLPPKNQSADNNNNQAQDTQSPSTQYSPPLQSSSDIYARAFESSATVICKKSTGNAYYSGFCVFNGFVVTVSDAALGDSISILCKNGSSYPATVASVLPQLSLALLKTDAPIRAASIGSAENIKEGDAVYAISGLENGKYAFSLLVGNISHTARVADIRYADGIQRRTNVMQIASICADNIEGSPIFDSNGDLIAMVASAEEIRGSGCLALPIGVASPILECMKNGVSISAEVLANAAYAPANLGILGAQGQKDGAWGIEVRGFSDTSSEAAEMLRIGDLIYKIDNTPVASTKTLIEYIDSKRASDIAEIFVIRDSQRLSFKIKLN